MSTAKTEAKVPAFNPTLIVPASKSKEFAGEADAGKRTARNILLDGIDKQIKLFKDPKADGRRWFVVGTNEVALTLRINNRAIPLAGEEVKVAVPVAHFEDAMNFYKSEVQAGTFDALLNAADERREARLTKLRATREAKKSEKK